MFYNLLTYSRSSSVADLLDTSTYLNLGSMTRYLVISPVSTGQLQVREPELKYFIFKNHSHHILFLKLTDRRQKCITLALVSKTVTSPD